MEVSEYCKGLEEIVQDRYLQKIKLIEVDPYLVNWNGCSTNVEHFPKILYPDIVNYLVYKKSVYTLEEVSAYKSLEAYNQAACGWVRKISTKEFKDYILVLGKVLHSQRLNEKCLSPWIIAKVDGQIECSHCDCVAGLGEVCTHVAAVLFVIDKEVRKLEEVTRTGTLAYWMPPTNKPSEPAQVADIDFTPAKKKFCQDVPSNKQLSETKNKPTIPRMSAEERKDFLRKLLDCGQTAVACAVTKPFSQEIQEYFSEKKKYFIMSFYKPEHEKSLTELREIAKNFEMTIPIEDCKLIERETVKQSKSQIWFAYRAGRITASKFKNCCRTKLENPSKSLIKSICYPETYSFKNKAVNYGCVHETEAIKDFETYMELHHTNFDVQKCGLIINPAYPYFGASPDGLSHCDCCGINLVEIKCPYCARFSGVEEKLQQKNFFLGINDGHINIKEDNGYYYQVQMQLAITKLDKCFLVAWSKKNLAHVEIIFNETFWERESIKAKEFFFKVILPEVIGKWYTKEEIIVKTEESDWNILQEQHNDDIFELVEPTKPQTSKPPCNADDSPIPSSSSTSVYCICQKPDDSKSPMIACDSAVCKIEWYHLSCIGLDTIPESPWICSYCKKE